MLVTPELLAMHFEVLKEYFTPVHLDDWLRAAKEGDPPPGRSLAITFDDGWRDNYDYAFPVLKAAEMPATLFLVTDMVGESLRFWPNRLAKILQVWMPVHARLLDEATRQHLATLGFPLDASGAQATSEFVDSVISRCKTADDSVMHALLDDVDAALRESGANRAKESPRDLLNWGEIAEMAACGLVRFGSHTRRHTRLRAGLSPEKLIDEVAGSQATIERHLDRPSKVFCYPNGDLSPQAYAAVKNVYEAAVSTRRGWHLPPSDSYEVPRIGIHEDIARSPSALLARVSGWHGA
jgi:peptidoglycan/xylan/chitin deacetylase (PgdA/CDA1 family)